MSFELVLCSYNVAYTNRRAAEDILRVSKVAHILLLQECKNVDVRAVLGPSWGVLQDTRDEGRAGSAIAWRKDLFEEGRGGLRLGVKPGSAAMLTRWIAWKNLTIEGWKIRVASCHRPPARYRFLDPLFDLRLKALGWLTRRPIFVGIDANDPLKKLSSRRMRSLGRGIVGLLVDRDVRVKEVSFGRKGGSDHQPTFTRVEIP